MSGDDKYPHLNRGMKGGIYSAESTYKIFTFTIHLRNNP
jgi:hypothetical protein